MGKGISNFVKSYKGSKTLKPIEGKDMVDALVMDKVPKSLATEMVASLREYPRRMELKMFADKIKKQILDCTISVVKSARRSDGAKELIDVLGDLCEEAAKVGVKLC